MIIKHIIDSGFWLVLPMNINLELIEPRKILLSYVNIFFCFCLYECISISLKSMNHNKELIIIFFFTCRHLLGEGLSSLNIKEMKQLESRIEQGLTRIKSKSIK